MSIQEEKMAWRWEERLLTYLVQAGQMSEAEGKTLWKETRSGEREEDLIRRGLVSRSELLNWKARCFGYQAIEVRTAVIEPKILHCLPEKLARAYLVMPLERKGKTLVLAMADPTDKWAIEHIAFYTACFLEVRVALVEDVRVALRSYLDDGSAQQREAAVEQQSGGLWTVDGDITGEDEVEPAGRLTDSLLRQAVAERASDVHWEVEENACLVRFRIDGVLEKRAILPYSWLINQETLYLCGFVAIFLYCQI